MIAAKKLSKKERERKETRLYWLNRAEEDSLFRGYLTTMLWAETDESTESGGNPLDENYSIEDIDPEAMRELYADCHRFRLVCESIVKVCDGRLKRPSEDLWYSAGHDLWLTARGHGAGFWDGDWPQPEAELLTIAAKMLGERNPYLGDDGRIRV